MNEDIKKQGAVYSLNYEDDDLRESMISIENDENEKDQDN